MHKWSIFKNGILNENPTFRLVLGMCPTLAVTSAVVNVGMGLAATVVLIGSDMISLLRNVIPNEVRIPCYVVVIATFCHDHRQGNGSLYTWLA